MRGKSEVQTEPRVPRLTRWPSSLGRLWPRVGLRGPRIAVRLPAPPCDSEKTRPGRAFPLRRTFPQGCAILIFPKRLRGRRGGEAAISPGPWPAAAARGGHIRLALDGGVRLSFTTDHERVALPIPHSGCSRGIYEVRSGCGPNAETPSFRTARTPRGLSSPHLPGDGRLSPSQGSSVRLRTVSSCWARWRYGPGPRCRGSRLPKPAASARSACVFLESRRDSAGPKGVSCSVTTQKNPRSPNRTKQKRSRHKSKTRTDGFPNKMAFEAQGERAGTRPGLRRGGPPAVESLFPSVSWRNVLSSGAPSAEGPRLAGLRSGPPSALCPCPGSIMSPGHTVMPPPRPFGKFFRKHFAVSNMLIYKL